MEFCHILVIGCPDLIAPEFAWHTREGDIATIGCETSDKTWHLKCEENRWVGVIGTCEVKGMYFVFIMGYVLLSC